MDLKNLTICVDAGWSSRRDANECCFIVIDNKTKLLFDLIVITRANFSGASGNMEAEGTRIFYKKHKNNINLVGVVKDGDTKLAKFFENVWNRVKILKDRNHLLKNLKKHIEENAKYRCVKNIKTTFTEWIRSKSVISWSSLELKLYIKLSLFHYMNIHDCCEHTAKYTDRYKFPDLNIIDKNYLLEKKKKLQDLIQEYLNILEKNIKIVEEKIISKTMKKADKFYWIGVLEEIFEKKKFFFFFFYC
ncbi:hypothetical protein M0812_19059 [Anaeramoeba flamelloides]|uniref:Uncharacterized protein n=1 Tax=Anaeramoeba flamelloides TaxID=1746091 RepID=A0AAV7Z4J1_9EUKA|nr:hypothetical protein M0812_19059 [Anaeramoeba flamelloides]